MRQADGPKLLKHFLPHFEGADPSLEQASALFTTFCFQKPPAAPEPNSNQQSATEATEPPASGALLQLIATCAESSHSDRLLHVVS